MLSSTMRNTPVGWSSGRNVETAIAKAPTSTSPNPSGFPVALFTVNYAIAGQGYSLPDS
ncbi:hypothetical protein L843_3655 [Mycobacterium intracellulare MIN_061107_1834]|nr:hypothetical protein L843_3655 [Mycobacterium intracellulare MIN_061107_1834]